MGARLLVVLAAAGALALYVMQKLGIIEGVGVSAPLPADPAGRRARAASAIQAADRTVTTPDGQSAEIPWDWLYFQAQLETGDFKLTKADGSTSNYALTRSLFNRHVGHGTGDWTKTSHMTSGGEDLRIYDSPEQSARDIILLYNDPLYADAAQAVVDGDRARWFEMVAEGDGTNGFVGSPTAPKAKQYIADLNYTAARGVIA